MTRYEVLAWQEGLMNSLDCYVYLGTYEASSPERAIHKALREVAEEPYDSEGCPILTPSTPLTAVTVSTIERGYRDVKMPQEVIDAWEEEGFDADV